MYKQISCSNASLFVVLYETRYDPCMVKLWQYCVLLNHYFYKYCDCAESWQLIWITVRVFTSWKQLVMARYVKTGYFTSISCFKIFVYFKLQCVTLRPLFILHTPPIIPGILVPLNIPRCFCNINSLTLITYFWNQFYIKQYVNM